jgi:hypothetical protein
MNLQIMPSASRLKSQQVVGSATASACYVCGRLGHQSHTCRAIPQEDRDNILKILSRCQKRLRKQDCTAQKTPLVKFPRVFQVLPRVLTLREKCFNLGGQSSSIVAISSMNPVNDIKQYVQLDDGANRQVLYSTSTY